MSNSYPKIDRLRKLKFDQHAQLAGVLLTAIHEHSDPVGIIEHLLVVFPHGYGSIEPARGDPKPEPMDDNELKFNRDRVSGRVDQVRVLLRTRNPTLHHAAEVIWGALCSLRTETEKAVAFGLMLSSSDIVPFTPIPEAVLQPVEPEYLRNQALERMFSKVNLLNRLFHDPNLTHQNAVRGAMTLLDEISDPTERYVLLEQIILIAAHLDCIRDHIRKEGIRLPDGIDMKTLIHQMIEHIRSDFDHEK